MTKNELIACLTNTEYINTMKGDELLDWLIDVEYTYTKDNPNDELDELFHKYWDPHDILEHIANRIRCYNSSEYEEPLDVLHELTDLLQHKEFNTYWSYFETDEETNFVDINDEDLHQLRLRMLEVLTREEKDD